MNSIGTMRTIPMLLILLISACHRGMGDKNQVAAASALFDQFETVFYTRADMLAVSGGYKLLHEQAADALRVPFASLLMGLDALGKSTSTEILGSADAVLVGAKDFVPPDGLGSVQSKFCYIVVLGGRPPNLSKIFPASSMGNASGNPIWQWTAPPQEGHPKPYTFYIAELSRSFILIANDQEEIQSLTLKLSSTDRNAPTLGNLQAWAFVSWHDYWGYRRYRRVGVGDSEAAGMEDITSTATGLVFVVDFWQRAGRLRLLASDGSTAERINTRISRTRSPLPPLKPSGIGAWETNVRLTGDEKAVENMFVVMGMFGFAVYL